MDNTDLKAKLKKLYLEGKTRMEAREACGLDSQKDNARTSGLSTQLGLHWSWPLQNRQSGIPPTGAQPVAPKKRNARKPAPVESKPAPAPSPTPKPQEALGQLLSFPAESKPVEEPRESIPTRPRLKPSPGFVPERVRRLRGLGADSSVPPAFSSNEDEFEKLIRTRLYG